MAAQRTRRDQSQWQKLVDQQSNSGLSAAAFCRNRNIGYPSFMAWRKRLLSSESGSVPQHTPTRFVELTPAYSENDNEFQNLTRRATHTCSSFCVELSLGDGIELRISRN